MSRFHINIIGEVCVCRKDKCKLKHFLSRAAAENARDRRMKEKYGILPVARVTHQIDL